MQIGITERGDAALDTSWLPWVIEGKPAILITKNPALLYRTLAELKIYNKPMNVIVHCTITGLGGTQYEPYVEPWPMTISWYDELIKLIGVERVVLRIDPIILYGTNIYQHEFSIRTATEVYAQRKGRVRISFMDNYPHVMDRFKKAGVGVPPYYMHAPIEKRREVYNVLFPAAEICGEPGMPCTGCVSAKDLAILAPAETVAFKIGGQRPACMCSAMKHELLSNRKPCAHGCLYCYWRG